jgi:HD-GYP domain-containing protein (c-di-GMP phosphodiesterase class II)
MDAVRVQDLRPGQAMDRPLYSPTGRLLLRAGVPLTAGMLRMLARGNDESFVLIPQTDDEIAALERGEVPALPSAADTTPTADPDAALDQPRPETIPEARPEGPSPAIVPPTPIVEIKPEPQPEPELEPDPEPTPAAEAEPSAGAAAEEDPEAADRAARRGRREARDARRELLVFRARVRRDAEAVIAARSARWARLALRVVPGVDPVPFAKHPELDLVDASELAEEITRVRAGGRELVRRTLARLIDGQETGPELLLEALDEAIDLASAWPARYAMLALGLPRRVDSIPDHGYAAGVLAVGAAIRLGWSPADTRAVGLTAMLADVGLALIPQPLRTVGRPLTEVEMNSVRRHAWYSAALLERARGLPEPVQLAVSQHHEREDGSGYPARLKGPRIHDYARLVAVADALAALTSPRAHRPALAPHDAIARVVRDASAGVYDRAIVRAVVDACGLFPVGSYVRLSTGALAVVVAPAQPGRLDRPTVRVVRSTWDRPAHGASRWLDRPIDLRAADVSVVGAVAG